MAENKSYYAIIPANVRYDKSLTANAKLLYGEITALCNDKGYCWASNGYFAELYGVSKKSVSNWVTSLSAKGYINISMEYKEGTLEIVHRYIRIVLGAMEEKVNTPMEEKVKDNNTENNNTINNTYNSVEVIDYFNKVTGKTLRHNSQSTNKHIIARFKEGYTLEDFKIVIDKKYTEWINTDMAKYIRPSTLFNCEKFENYLNQLDTTKKVDQYNMNTGSRVDGF